MKSIYIFLSTIFLISCGQQPSNYKPIVSPPKPTSVLAPIMQNNLWGFIDTNGVVIIPVQFKLYQNQPKDFPIFHEGLCVFVDPKTLSKGAIDSSGAWAIKPRFYDLYNFCDGVANCMFRSNDLPNVFVNKKDSLIKYYGFKDISPFITEGLAYAKKDTLYGFIDHSGKFIIEPKFYSTLFFTYGYAMVDIGNTFDQRGQLISKFRFINMKGEILSPDQYDNVDEPFLGGFAFVSKDVPAKWGQTAQTKQGLINRKGKLVVPLSFHFLFSNFFRDGLEFAIDYDEFQKGSRLAGLIDSTGKWITQPIFENAMAFSEDVAPVKQNGKWGFIDKKGKMVITPQFDSVHVFAEGLAAASINGKYGFIDHSGKWVIEPSYEDASYFKFGLAPVRKNFKYGYVNKKGKWIVEPSLERAGAFQNVKGEKSGQIYYQ